MNITDFQAMKQAKQMISVVTCYDYWSAKIVAQSDVDVMLVGDSLAMVMHGHTTTIPATVDLMKLHIEAVVRGASGSNKLIIGDMPFLSYRKGLVASLDAIEKIMQAGAQAVKLEGAIGNEELIKHTVASGVPVMGHIGMTPQSVHQLGGFRVQGKSNETAEKIFQQALALEDSGCFSLVLECVPSELAHKITQRLHIPTIGIGAGAGVDGQVLVLQDLFQ